MLEQAQVLLQKHFGYPSFKEGQAKVISSLIAGEDTLAIMPTGAGKSVCYQIPSMMFDGVTLVISPLIALMKDQVDGLGGLDINATFINSSLSAREVKKRLGQAGKGQYKLIYVAPERLESESFLELAETLEVSFLAIDEAHCVSQWGHDFRPSYRRIAQFVSRLGRRPVLGAFTATATEEIRKDIVSLLALKTPNVYVTGFDRENLFFGVARGENKKDFVLDYVKNGGHKSGIIYAATRREVDSL
jgi:ATP-dependent DNA helicase RecQ